MTIHKGLQRLGIATGAAALLLGVTVGTASAGTGPNIKPCTACQAFRPDLTVSFLDPDHGRATIRNDGPLTAGSSWAYVRNNFQRADAVVSVPSLRPGQAYTFSFPASVSSDHCAFVVADYYDQIEEITNANNVGAVHDAYCG